MHGKHLNRRINFWARRAGMGTAPSTSTDSQHLGLTMNGSGFPIYELYLDILLTQVAKNFIQLDVIYCVSNGEKFSIKHLQVQRIHDISNISHTKCQGSASNNYASMVYLY